MSVQIWSTVETRVEQDLKQDQQAQVQMGKACRWQIRWAVSAAGEHTELKTQGYSGVLLSILDTQWCHVMDWQGCVITMMGIL